MTETMKQNRIFSDLKRGLTAAGIIFGYAVCFVAATNVKLIFALICSIACASLSLKLKGSIMAPHPFLAVPFIYILSHTSSLYAAIALSIAAIFFLIFKKIKGSTAIPNNIFAGICLSLALSATILLTNVYFGIGSFGSTPLEMLKNYRYLGFHPNFMGLLTGTITLFTMITYPFKFKKLSKIIPPVFITIFIPFILNLFLNPQREYTTINEASGIGKITDFSLSEEFIPLNKDSIIYIIEAALFFFLLFLVLSQNNRNKDTGFSAITNVFSCVPAMPHSFDGYSPTAAIVVILSALMLTIFCPDVLHRLPLHSVGAMLIVTAWQSTPFKEIGECFKKKSLRSIVPFFTTTISFIVFRPFIAIVICIIALLISSPDRKEFESK